MFFWMYALIELLAMFLDSGVIPTSNAAYTVRTTPIESMGLSSDTQAVVCCSLHRIGGRDILLSSDQRFCWVPVCRGWHTVIFMGKPPRSRFKTRC